MAYELKWPVSLIKQLTTVSEFDNWQAYFRDRLARHEKPDYYAAATIRAIYASQGAKVSKNLSEFLLDFEVPKESKKSDPKDSQSVWLALFNIDPEQT